jgi:solute carrier family 25 citrate transporter 1
VFQAGSLIAREEGVRALWKGLTPFSTQLCAKYALRFSTNAFYQGLMRDKDGNLGNGGRMAAGFAAGVTEALILVTPFEVVKIRLQQQKGLAKEALKYKGPIHTAGVIVREEGVRGLWSGATPTVMRNGTNQLCMFWAKHNFDRIYWGKAEGDGKALTPGQSMASGFSAAILGPIATCPFDVVKTRLMAQAGAPPGTVKYSGLVDALIKIGRDEGVLSLWRGLTPRLMRIPPGQAIVWAVSDQVTGYFEARARAQRAAGK